MTPDPDLWLRRRRCNAVKSLARTVRTMRQHADTPRLRDAALRACVEELRGLLAESELSVELCEGEAHCEGRPILRFGPDEAPFGLLAVQGIGELHLESGTPADSLERLLDLFAAGGPERDLAAEIHGAHLPGVHLRAPDLASAPRLHTGHGIDWWLLPEPRNDDSLRPLVERELDANLPLQCARLLLADLEESDPASHHLVALLSALLDAGDAQGATWILEQSGHGNAVPADVVRTLRDVARRAFESARLPTWLEHGERMQGLVALAMELGGDSLERLGAAAARTGTPLPGWISSMLPPGE